MGNGLQKKYIITKSSNSSNNKFLIREFLVGTILSIILFLFIIVFYENLVIDGVTSNFSSIYSTLMQVSGSLLGFVLTGVSILIIASNQSIFKEYKKAGHFHSLIRLFTITLYLLGLDTIFFLIVLVINDSKLIFFFFLTIWLIILTVIFLFRSIQAITKLSLVKLSH